MASAHSCFFPLAARPLSAARTGCLTFLVALLWLCAALPAHALRSPLPPPDRAAIQTSPVETRAGDFSFAASGRLSLDLEPDPINTPGCAACAYETASGRRKWLNRDPIGERYDANLYRFVYNSPLNYVDPDGLTGWALNNPARWGNPSAPDFNPNYPGPTAQDLEVAGAVASIFIEPLDWAMTAGEIYNDPSNPWSYAGLIPFVPSAAGKGGKALCNLKRGGKLTKDELDKLYPRVTPRRGLADEVWERSKAPDGKVYDPSGVEIKPGEYWELGHTPGNKFSDAQQRAAEEGWDRSTWRQYQNDPDIYRPELRPTNRGHRYESDW